MRPQAVRKPAARKGKTMHPKCNLRSGLGQARVWVEGYQTGETVAVCRLFDLAPERGTEAAIFAALLARQNGRLV